MKHQLRALMLLRFGCYGDLFFIFYLEVETGLGLLLEEYRTMG